MALIWALFLIGHLGHIWVGGIAKHVVKNGVQNDTCFDKHQWTNRYTKGRFTLWWRRPPVGQECLAKTWLYKANGGYMCRRKIKGYKIFLLSWASPEEEFLVPPLETGQETPSPEKPNSKKCRHVRRPCHFIIHEKSSSSLFSSPNVNTNQSRVAFSTNHNWERPFFHDRWTSPP